MVIELLHGMRETTETIKDYGIDFSAIYGAVGKVDFNGLLAYVGATDALPIWVKPKIENE